VTEVKRFLAWLAGTVAQGGDEVTAAVRALLSQRQAELEAQPDLNALQADIAANAPELNKAQILEAIDAAIPRWRELADGVSQVGTPLADQPALTTAKQPASPKEPETQTEPADQQPGKLQTFMSYLPLAGLTATIALPVGLIFLVLLSPGILRMMSDIAVSRGLITFLFAIGTISIALILTAALFLGNSEGLKDRFDHGREVLTALIAILGTIVGFYFGSEGSRSSPGGEIKLETVTLSEPAPRAGQSLQLSTLASGGHPPYRYMIDFRAVDQQLDKELQDVSGKESPNGLIVGQLTVPEDGKGKDFSYLLTVVDAQNRSASVTGSSIKVQ
jgi:hypothetical protein